MKPRFKIMLDNESQACYYESRLQSKATKRGDTMSEEQKKRAAEIAAEMNKLAPAQRETALAYIQGMAAAAQILNKGKTENEEA